MHVSLSLACPYLPSAACCAALLRVQSSVHAQARRLCSCWDTCGRDKDTVLCPGRATEGSCSTALSTRLQICQESFRGGQGQTRGSRAQPKPCPCTGKAGGSCVPLPASQLCVHGHFYLFYLCVTSSHPALSVL